MLRTTQATDSTRGAVNQGTQAVPATMGQPHVEVPETQVDVAMSGVERSTNQTSEPHDPDTIVWDSNESGQKGNVRPVQPGHVGELEDNGSAGSDAGVNVSRRESRRKSRDPPPTIGKSRAVMAARLRKLEIEERMAVMRAEIKRLKARKANGFRAEPGSEPAAKNPRVDKNALALERAKGIKRPDKYSGQSQKHLDEFLWQAEATFRTKPTIYSSDADKCIYAGESLAEKPQTKWAAIDDQIRADPARNYCWKAFVTMLQHDLLSQAQERELNLYFRIAATRQRKNQSVGDFFSHLNFLERQLRHEVSDIWGRYLIVTKVHPHLRKALQLQDDLGKTRQDLQDVLRAIEKVEPMPPGITVKGPGKGFWNPKHVDDKAAKPQSLAPTTHLLPTPSLISSTVESFDVALVLLARAARPSPPLQHIFNPMGI